MLIDTWEYARDCNEPENEFFYNHDFAKRSYDKFRRRLIGWIQWYSYERIKESLGFVGLVECRLTNILAA